MGQMEAHDRFAYRLEYFREKMGLTKHQFAERCGIDINSYNYYINKGGMPTLYTAMQIAAGLGMTLDQLMGIKGGRGK